ncbi:MAG: hypothetical protein OEW79_13465, partial [Betaproteobacteria bacterium]|nr:hypothetical protein [Betaproteobacteria bacterium]
ARSESQHSDHRATLPAPSECQPALLTLAPAPYLLLDGIGRGGGIGRATGFIGRTPPGGRDGGMPPGGRGLLGGGPT